MPWLQSKPAVGMTLRKEEGTATGRSLGCVLGAAREGRKALHRRAREGSFGSKRSWFFRHRLGSMRTRVLWCYSRNEYNIARGL